ncbi:MAG: translocation/assembly module TamB domain-containing protein [Pleurocapsa minor HA4230-MV1]|nr:translocation/assembly module TamB domain-containing protein [Pleurocapsa minor HA4230-MV1]
MTLFKKPSTIAIGSIILAFGVLGCIGTRWVVTKKLPPFLEQQLNKSLERPIDLGDVESFSLNSITFDKSTVSVNDEDPDYATIDRVKVAFNLLPVLFRGVLPLEVTLIDPDIYLKQDKNGSWLELPSGSSEGGGLPIDFDITVAIESGEVALLTNEKPNPINLQVDGEVNYNQAQPQDLRYDLETEIGEATANIAGKTSIETGQTKTQILVQDLFLSKVIPLLPNNLPINLQNGELNANLNINIPSFKKINNTRIQGTLNLQQIKAKTEQLDKPIKARSRLRFQGEKVKINNTQASIGDIVARVDGRIHWKKGYDVDITVPSFALKKLLNIAPVRSPVDVTGVIKADLKLSGAITKPLLQGTIGNTQPVTIAETKLNTVEAELAASLEKIVLEDLSIIPAAGGKITGQGLVQTNVGDAQKSAMPLGFKLQAQLPAEELLQPYFANSVPFNVDRVTAVAIVDGTVAQPEVLVNWQAPSVNTTSKTDLSGTGEILYDDSILTVRDTNLKVNSGEINLSGTANLAENNWQAVLDANNVTLNPFLQPLVSEQLQLNELVALETGTVRLNGKFAPQALNTIDGVANLNLDVGSGDVSLRSGIDSGNLNIAANAINIPASNFLTNVELAEPIDAQFDLSADLNSIAANQVTVKTNNVAVQVGEQSLEAEGEIVLSNLAKNFDIANVDLNLQANSNLNTLPNELLDNIAANNQLIAENFDLAGNAAFTGRLRGQNLLTQSLNPGNLNLTGNLRLQNFAVGNTAFEPRLSGTVNVSPGEELSINLQGQQDIIAADLEPCQNSQCPLPYLPTFIRLRQGEGTPEPIVVAANRQGEVLDIDVRNFPLSILNLSPATNLGITEALTGDVTGEALVNLFTLATTGEVEVIDPSVGYIDGEAITAQFAYLPEENLARLTSAVLEFGNSIYTLQGALNLATQEIEGTLNIPQAYIQDLISAFGWYDLQRVTELFQPPDLAEANALSSLSVGKKDAKVSYLLKLLIIVQQRLQQIAAESNGLAVPLDLEGAYTGNVAISGSLTSPNLTWQIFGNNWLWDTSRDVVFDIPRQPGIINIDELLIEGNYNNGVLALDSLLIQLAQAVVALEGKLRSEQVTADFKIQDLPIDTIGNFIDIPVDLAGRISTTGEVSGTLPTPRIIGDITLENATLSDRSLPKIAGNYVYNNARLELDTTQTPSAQIQASIPFPIKPGNDRVSLTANLDEGGIALIDGFTGGAIEFLGGEADVTLAANGRLDLSQDFFVQDLDATGEIILNNTTLQTAAFTEPLDVTAEIAIEERLIKVQQLAGTFAKSKISATGVLPLLEPRNKINNPLTLVFQESEIDLDQLYEGGVEGEIIITGDAFSPLIGGEIELFDGQAFVPDDESESENTETASTNSNNTNTENAFRPRLQDFTVAIEDLRFQFASVYRFVLGGDLILNGAANNVPEIQAGGTLQLTQANVDFASSEFNLQRDYDNAIVFDPEETILNPLIDIRLQTEVSELANIDLGVVDDNEIPAPIAQVGRNETIDVTLAVEGEAEEIIPRINEAPRNLCRIEPPFEPLFEANIYTQEELNQLSKCVNFNAFAEGSARELINSPAVNLSSNPPRSQGAIISLLGNKFIGLAEQLQDSNEEQLFEFGVTQFLITPIEQEIFNFADETINNLGEKIGLDYLQIYPTLEGTYQLTNDDSVSATYDYFFNEFQVRYQKQF